MKRSVKLFMFLFLILCLNVFVVSAELNSTYEQEKVNLAYDCLNNEIDILDCSRMTAEQAIFSLLAVEKCKLTVEDFSLNSECWPKNNCDLATTSQAILALDQIGEDTSDAEEWLISHNATPTDLNWFLEVDSTISTSCTTSYGANSFSYIIGEDKKITKNPGENEQCLTVSDNEYWIKVNDACYDQTFKTTCDEDFLTTLLFQEQDSSTIYILKSTHAAVANAVTEEKINSFCFSKSGSVCNYEGSLWATLILGGLGYDVGAYMPYLISEASAHPELSPESFLYTLTGEIEYRTSTLENQISEEYWQNGASNNKYYDTALNLIGFKGEYGITEKQNSKEWLITKVQDDAGCWDNKNIVTNAFLLYTIWPEYFESNYSVPPGSTCFSAGYDCLNESMCSGTILNQYTCENDFVCCNDDFGGTGGEDMCEDAGYFCVPVFGCSGNIFNSYDCAGTSQVCCDASDEKTCAEFFGEICASNEYCDGGDPISTPDLEFSETCCISGICKNSNSGSGNDLYTCGQNFGVCEPFSCESDYEETSQYDCAYGDICCIKSSLGSSSGPNITKSKWWIWVLFALIVIVLIGILFRDKLKGMFGKKPKFKGQGPRGFPPRTPPSRPMPARRPMPQRRIMPPSRPPAPNSRRVAPKRSGELNDVLKKLKDMSS